MLILHESGFDKVLPVMGMPRCMGGSVRKHPIAR